MYITADDIKHEVSLYYPIDNRNGDKKVRLIRAYFVYSFYNVESDEKIHLNPILLGLLKTRWTWGGGGFCPPPNSLVFNYRSIKFGR